MAGGHDNAAYQNEIDGLSFATEAQLNPAATLSVSATGLAGVSSVNVGYFCGGSTATLTYTDNIDRITFSTEAVNTISANIGIARLGLGGTRSSTNGYLLGGYYSPTRSNYIDKISFATEAVGAAGCTLATTRSSGAAVYNDDIGIMMGGLTGSSTKSTSMGGLAFATETSSVPAASLSLARYNMTGVQGGAA
ncbi:MAG: hypothetical protein WC279_14590 [Sulfurimonas sp.]|uniref:hypothetical protein n=1 Tax=Sulfurimonas sp. TaxID=2022749 RepID=UPI00356B5948